ncbi:ATP-binding protein [Streptomyces sp. NPDC002306]
MRELLSAWDIDDDTCDDAVAVVSELVTNAVTHTGSARITCRLRAVPGRVHLEVEDESHGAGHPVPRQPHPDDQGGRGLLLVAALSGDWGVRDTADRGGRIVWAELLTPDTDSRPAPPHGTTRPIPHSAEGPLPYESTAHP